MRCGRASWPCWSPGKPVWPASRRLSSGWTPPQAPPYTVGMGGLATLAILLAATVSASDVDVRATAGGRVTLRVASAPLSEVLDRLSRQIGMKVIYDGQPPRTVVRGRQVEDATPADALANILEGLGVSYALRLDATGAKVETLLILGAAGGSVGTSSVGTTASTAMPVTRPGLPTTRVPRAPRVAPPVAADDEGDDEVSQEA